MLTEDVVNPATTVAADNNSTSSSGHSQRSGWLQFMASFAFVIAVLAVIGLALGWQRFMHLQSASKADVKLLQQSSLQQQQQTAQLQQQLQHLQLQLAQQNQQLQTQQTSLNQLTQRAFSDDINQIVSETEYLLQMANLSLTFNHDINTAIVLL